MYARKKVAMAQVLAEVPMFDCCTGKTLSSCLLASTDSASTYHMRGSSPVEPIDSAIANTAIRSWTEEQRIDVRERSTQLPVASWEMTLRHMRAPWKVRCKRTNPQTQAQQRAVTLPYVPAVAACRLSMLR